MGDSSAGRKLLIYGFAIIAIARLIMVFTMGLMPQDAYYYFYSQHLSLSYFDHPPGVAVMLWLGSKLLGSAVWGLKLTDFLVTCGMLCAYYFFARRFMSKAKSFDSLLIFGGTLVATNVSIVATPDVPLLLFWTLALIAICDALCHDGLLRWLLAGVFCGLAFDAKYTALYLPIALVFYLLFSNKHRRYLISWRVPVFSVAFILTISPVIVWNATHDLASFQFQSGNRMASILEFRFRPQYFFAVVGHQMALLIPVLAISIGIVSWKHLKKILKRWKLPDEETLFLLVFSLPLIIGFLGIAWVYWVKINWMLPAYIAASVLALRVMPLRWKRWQMGIAVCINLLLLTEIVFYPVPIRSDDTFWGWDRLATAVEKLQKQHPDSFVFSADGYKTTAILNYYLKKKVYAGNVLGEHALEYSITDIDLSPLRGKDAVFIDSRNTDLDQPYVPPASLSQYFNGIRVLPPILLKNKRGATVREFAVVECLGYIGTQE